MIPSHVLSPFLVRVFFFAGEGFEIFKPFNEIFEGEFPVVSDGAIFFLTRVSSHDGAEGFEFVGVGGDVLSGGVVT